MLRTLIEQLILPQNFKIYIWLILELVIFTLSGITIAKKVWNTRNKLIILSGGMILGPLGYLLVIGITSYFFKGPTSILLIFTLYSALSIPTIRSVEKKIKELIENKDQFLNKKLFNLSNIILITLIAVYSVFFLYITNASIIGGDVSTYWTIAASFSQGNYPIYTSWQPNFLISYHAGTSIFLGSLHAISNVILYSVHFFFSYYLILAIFLFVTGLVREYTKSIVSIIPAIIMLLSFGGPVIMTKGYDQFISDINFRSLSLSFESISKFPRFVEYVGAGGNCGASIGDLAFCNFRTFGTAALLVFIYTLLQYKATFSLKQSLLLVSLIILTLSIDESLVPSQLLLFSIFFFYRYIKDKAIIKGIKTGIIILISFLLLFFIIQNPIRDSLLTKRSGESRFTFIGKNIHELESRKNFIKYRELKINDTNWYLPDLRLIALISIVFAIALRSSLLITLTSAGVITGSISFIAMDYYYPGNGYRFLYLTYNFLILSISISLILGLLNKNKISKIFCTIILTLFFLPQLLVAHAYQLNQIQKKELSQLTANLAYKNTSLEWIQKNIPSSKKLLFVDTYPYKSNYPPATLGALTGFGITTPIGPPYDKILNTETSSEWFDAITTLSPQSLNLLGIDYLYIYSDQYQRFSENRQNQLKNSEYFKLVKRLDEGELFEVSQKYKKLDDKELTTQKIIEKIPDNSSVFIDKFPRYIEIRRGLLLYLTQKNQVYGPIYINASDFYNHIEYIPKYTYIDSLDEAIIKNQVKYVLTPPETENNNLKNIYTIIIQNNFINLWERK